MEPIEDPPVQVTDTASSPPTIPIVATSVPAGIVNQVPQGSKIARGIEGNSLCQNVAAIDIGTSTTDHQKFEIQSEQGLRKKFTFMRRAFKISTETEKGSSMRIYF